MVYVYTVKKIISLLNPQMIPEISKSFQRCSKSPKRTKIVYETFKGSYSEHTIKSFKGLVDFFILFWRRQTPSEACKNLQNLFGGFSKDPILFRV